MHDKVYLVFEQLEYAIPSIYGEGHMYFSFSEPAAEDWDPSLNWFVSKLLSFGIWCTETKMN